MENIRSYKDLRVYKSAMDAAMSIYELSKRFPFDERYSLTDQIRRASRSVCANIGEGWRKRRYPLHFVSKLSDSETEAEETRVWLEFSWKCGYVSREQADELDRQYNHIIAQLVLMIQRSDQWTIRVGQNKKHLSKP
jgi:four helix bundle protein